MTIFTNARACHGAPIRHRVSIFDLFALARQRRQLAKLDANALRDIGLSKRAAEDEAKRPLWDVPDHWVG